MSTTTPKKLYISNHGHPLLWQEPLDVPVVTVENYDKWYSLYVLFPDGRVETVPAKMLLDVDKSGNCLWIDHCFHPKLLLLIAKHYGGCSHPTALEMAAGRWVMEERQLKPEMCYFLDENEEN